MPAPTGELGAPLAPRGGEAAVLTSHRPLVLAAGPSLASAGPGARGGLGLPLGPRGGHTGREAGALVCGSVWKTN